MDGILNLDKPAGPTSHQVVVEVRKSVPGIKVGHAGTLDPAATGVLPVCLGKATRIVEYLMEHRKGYRAVVSLGTTTDTEDAAGQVLEKRPVPDLSLDQVEALLKSLTGAREQQVPAYSAVKYRGKPLYYWARQGKEIRRKVRKINIYRLELLEYNPADAPRLVCEVECSRGTYIRTLAAEIGRRIGCGAHLSALSRLFVGPFTLAEAFSLEEFRAAVAGGEPERCLAPMDRALQHLPEITVSREAIVALKQGKAVSLDQLGRIEKPDTAGSLPLRVYDPGGRFSALARWRVLENTVVLKTEKFLAM